MKRGVFDEGRFRACGWNTQRGSRQRVPECMGRAVYDRADRCTCPEWSPRLMDTMAEHKLSATNAQEIVEALMSVGIPYRAAMAEAHPRDPFYRAASTPGAGETI